MESDTVVITPKRWAKLFFIFFACPFIIIVPGYLLKGMLFSDTLDTQPLFLQIFLVLAFIICVLSGIYGIIAFSRAKIIMDDKGIKARQLIDKEITYGDIRKIKVYPNGLTLSDGSLRNQISMDLLYNNVDSAIAHLASKIERSESVIIKGDEKAIKNYFE